MKTLAELAKLKFNPFAQTDSSQDGHLVEYFFDNQDHIKKISGEENKGQIIWGRRGSGKTAARIMLERNLPKDQIAVVYNRFPPAIGNKRTSISLAEHLAQLDRLFLIRIFALLENARHDGILPNVVSRLKESDRYLLGYLAYAALDEIEREEFEATVKEMTSVRLVAARALEWFERPGRVQDMLKQLISALLNGLKGAVIDAPTTHDISNLKDQVPDIGPWEAKNNTRMLTYLKRLVSLLPQLGVNRAYVLIDNVDELQQTSSAPEASIQLLGTLLNHLELYSVDNLWFKFFLWDRARPHFVEKCRADRFASYEIRWLSDDLAEMLKARIRTASSNGLDKFKALFGFNIGIDVDELIAHVAAGSPRDMVRLANKLVTADGITSKDAVWSEIQSFCRHRVDELLPNDDRRNLTNQYVNDYATLAADQRERLRNAGALTIIDQQTLPAKKGLPPTRIDLYGFGDLRFAIARMPGESMEALLRHAYTCPTCQRVLITNRSRAYCEPHFDFITLTGGSAPRSLFAVLDG